MPKKPNVFKAAKALRKKHPRKFKSWQDYVKAAGKKGKRRVSGTRKQKPAKKKTVAKKTVRRKRPKNKKVLKQVERVSVERTVAGRKRRRRPRKHKPVAHRRRRMSGAGGGSGLLTAVALGVGGLLLYNAMSKPTAPATYTQLPPVQQTGNVTRDTQSQDIVNYAIAAGLTIDAITSLIDRLNRSSDDDINGIYDNVNTTGDVGIWA